MALLLRQRRVIAYGAGLVLVYFLALSLVYLWFMDSAASRGRHSSRCSPL